MVETLIASLGALAATVASTAEAPFAIRCTGSSISVTKTPEGNSLTNQSQVDDVYVIDPAQQKLERVIARQQKLDNMCYGKLSCLFSLSPGLVTLRVLGRYSGHVVDAYYEFDRRTGKARVNEKLELLDGSYPNRRTQDLTCARAPMPVFDIAKNKF